MAVRALQELFPLLCLDNGLFVDTLQAGVGVVVGIGEVHNDVVVAPAGRLSVRPRIIVVMIVVMIAAAMVVGVAE